MEIWSAYRKSGCRVYWLIFAGIFNSPMTSLWYKYNGISVQHWVNKFAFQNIPHAEKTYDLRWVYELAIESSKQFWGHQYWRSLRHPLLWKLQSVFTFNSTSDMMMDDFLHKPQLALPSRLMDSRHFTWQRSKTSVSRLKVDIEQQISTW